MGQKLEDKLSAIVGGGVFCVAASLVASSLPPAAAIWVIAMATIVLVSGLGSIILSVLFGGHRFDHLFAGFVLASAGFCLVHFALGWHLYKPDTILQAKIKACVGLSGPSCYGGVTFVRVLVAMIKNLWALAVGMAIVALPMLPVISKLKEPR